MSVNGNDSHCLTVTVSDGSTGGGGLWRLQPPLLLAHDVPVSIYKFEIFWGRAPRPPATPPFI